MSLLDDIKSEVERDGRHSNQRGCNACTAILTCEDEETREALRDVFAGKISVRACIELSQKNDLGVGYRSLTKHRREEHQP